MYPIVVVLRCGYSFFGKMEGTTLCNKRVEHLTVSNSIDFWHLTNLTEEDLRALLKMIKGAGLLERRTFDGVKQQLEKLLGE